MKTKTLDLINPFDLAAGTVSKLVLREPTGRDVMTFGEPYIQTQSSDGAIVAIENAEAIEGYMTQCVVDPAGINVIDRVGLTDFLRLKDAVFGFFSDARMAGLQSAPNSSSSDFNGLMPPPSEIAPSPNSNGGSNED